MTMIKFDKDLKEVLRGMELNSLSKGTKKYIENQLKRNFYLGLIYGIGFTSLLIYVLIKVL